MVVGYVILDIKYGIYFSYQNINKIMYVIFQMLQYLIELVCIKCIQVYVINYTIQNASCEF